MSRQYNAQKRMYDDINPTFGLNKRGRNNSLPFSPMARQQMSNIERFPLGSYNPGTGRRPTQSVKHQGEPQFPFGPTVDVSESSLDSPYFNSRNTTLYNEKSKNAVPLPTLIQNNKKVPSAAPIKAKNRNGIHILTGTVEKVLLWSKMTRNHRVLFEIYGFLDYVRQGTHQCEKIFNMRDSNSSPTLQVAFYEIDRPLMSLEPGSIVKVQGNMTSRSRLQAFNVQKCNEEELNASQRIFYICDRAVHDLIN